MSHRYTAWPHQDVPLVGAIFPSSRGAGSYYTDVVDFSLMRQLYAMIASGVNMGSNPTLDFLFQAAPSSSGPFVDIDAAWKISQITAASKVEQLTLRAEAVPLKLTTDGAGRYVRGRLVVGGTGSTECSVMLHGLNLRYEPGDGDVDVVPSYVHANYFTNS